MRPLPFVITSLLLLFTSVSAAVDPAQLEPVRALMRDRAKLPEAQAALDALVASQPREAELHALLGQVRLRRDDAEGAVKAGEQAIALAPENSNYHRQLGDAYGRSAQKAGTLAKFGWARKCKATYEKAVQLDPTNIEARSSLLSYYQQAPGVAGGSMGKAYAQAAEIKRLDPERGRMAFAGLYVADKKYAEAFAEFEEVLRTSPENYAALYQVGRIAAVSGERIERGLETLNRCLILTPPEGQPGHAPTQWRIGNLLEKQGNRSGARAAYQAALTVDPNFAPASDSLKQLN